MVRLPKNLSTNFTFKSGVIKTGESVLEQELLAEKAYSLSLAAKHMTEALEELIPLAKKTNARSQALQNAADSVQAYFIPRELMGMNNHSHPIEHYNIPKDVLARLGVK